MLILEIVLLHFGKFHNKKVTFSPGINVIYGSNEAGKTTIHSFIRGMILGIEKPRGRESKDDLYTKYLPWETPSMYGGTMQIRSDHADYQIERSFYKENKLLRVVHMGTGRIEQYESWQTPPQFGNLTKESYRNTVSMEQNKSTTDQELADHIKNYLANLTTSKSNEVDIAGALQELTDKKKKLRNPRLLQRLEQIHEELKELPILEKQRDVLENQIATIGAKQESLLVKQHQKQVQTGEMTHNKSRNYLKKSSIFAAIWFLLLLSSGFVKQEKIEHQILVYVLFAVVGIVLFCVLQWRERQNQSTNVEVNLDSKESILTTEDEQKCMLQLERLNWELEKLDERISQLGILQEEQKELDRQLDSANENIAAVDLAIQTITRLAEEIHDGFGRQFNETISQLAEEITNRTYEKVYVDEKLNVKVRSGNSFLSMNQLSAGTMDQLFLALRLAAANLLLDKNMPIILDDSLSLYDETRCRSTLELLAKGNRQVLLFTCHKREKEILDQLDLKYKLIEL